jgi:Cu+-exporting ATPase
MKLIVTALTALLLLTTAAFAKDTKAEIKVSGMTCAACARGLQATLEREKGVKQAEVKMETETAIILYDDAQTSEQQLREAINKTGFKAEPNKEKR